MASGRRRAVDVDRFTGHVVVDGLLVVGDADGWWSYDAAADAWTRLPQPGVRIGAPEAALDGRVYSHVGSRVQILDLATSTWTELAPDPLEPRLQDAGVLATDAGVVLTGVELRRGGAGRADPDPGRRLGRQHLAAAAPHRDDRPAPPLDGRAARRRRDRQRGRRAGQRLGPRVPLRRPPRPATGEWSELPAACPATRTSTTATPGAVEAAAGPLVATAGFVYDDQAAPGPGSADPSRPCASDVAAVVRRTTAWSSSVAPTPTPAGARGLGAHASR